MGNLISTNLYDLYKNNFNSKNYLNQSTLYSCIICFAIGIIFIYIGIANKKVNLLFISYGLFAISYIFYRKYLINLRCSLGKLFIKNNVQTNTCYSLNNNIILPVHCKNHDQNIIFNPFLNGLPTNNNDQEYEFTGLLIKKTSCTQHYPNYIAKHKRSFIVDEYLCDKCYENYIERYSHFEPDYHINDFFFKIKGSNYWYYGKKDDDKYIYIINKYPQNMKIDKKYNIKNPYKKIKDKIKNIPLEKGIEIDINLDNKNLDKINNYDLLNVDMDKYWIYVYNKKNKYFHSFLKPFYFNEKNYKPKWKHSEKGFCVNL